ncbi:MAG: hypothetical protein PVH62_04960 [Anaerolineae bacterium]|jgi:hypothetical protein
MAQGREGVLGMPSPQTPNIEKLKSNRNVKGLIKALDYIGQSQVRRRDR